jgi:hypothetical protein
MHQQRVVSSGLLALALRQLAVPDALQQQQRSIQR